MSFAHRRFKSLSLERLENRSMFAAGALDASLDGDGMVITNMGPGATNGATSAGVQMDGTKIVVAGTIPGANGTDPVDFAVVRYLENGSLDLSFGVGGKASTSFGVNVLERVADLAVTPDGKYVVVGATNAAHAVGNSTVNSFDFAIARFNANGTLDTTFSSDGKATFEFGAAADFEEATAVVVQPDGKIVVGGDYAVSGSQDKFFALTRFNVDGSVDTTFGVAGKVLKNFGSSSDNLLDLELQNVGGQSYIVASGRALIGGAYDVALVRFQMNGALDLTFGQAGVVLTDVQGSEYFPTLLIQPDSKIIAVGSSSGGLQSDGTLIRYHANGTLDSSFGNGGIAVLVRPGGQGLTGAALQPDGKIVVGGTWTYTGTPDYRQTLAARFDSSGNLDSTFGNNGISLWDVNPANNSVNDELASGGIALQADGRIVIAGGVQPVGATTRTQWAVSRLTADNTVPIRHVWTANDFNLLFGLLLGKPTKNIRRHESVFS